MADCHAWKRNICAAALIEEAAVVAVVMVPQGTMAPSNLGGCMGIIRREDVRAACMCCCWPERASSIFENAGAQWHSLE